nr:MAG TPA: hypothetical protein [Caudoviricetes sp.]
MFDTIFSLILTFPFFEFFAGRCNQLCNRESPHDTIVTNFILKCNLKCNQLHFSKEKG